MNIRRLCALLTLFLVASAGPTLAKKKEFTDTTSVVVVEVPVNVIRDGEPVRGLQASDFELLDGRKKVELVGFEEVDLQMLEIGTEEQDEPVPMAARRHFLLLFDLSYSSPAKILQARRAAKATLLRDLHATDLIAVATYATNRGPQLILNFTPDHRQAELALETLGTPNLLDLQPDPLQIILGDPNKLPGFSDDFTDSAGGSEDGRDFDAMVEEHLQSIYRVSADSQRKEQSDRVSALTKSFSGLANLMAGIEGRKHVVYFSEGFDSSLLLGSSDDSEALRAQSAAVSGEIWDVNSQQRFGDTSTVNDLENMVESFRRANCAVQSVDIGGLRTGGDMQSRPAGKDGMVAMAKGSGGNFYENFTDLGEAVSELLERTSVTYVLAFQPQKLKYDGKYHKLKVKLVGGPSGAKLEHRPGYYSPKPREEQHALERKMSTSEQILGGKTGGTIQVASVATPFRIEAEKAYVPVFIEVDGSTLMGGKREGQMGVEVYTYAMSRSGGLADFFTNQVGLDLAQIGASLEQGGLKFYGHLDLDPGTYSLRILVRNIGTGANSMENLELVVPDWDRSEPLLLDPVFPEAPGRWVMIREGEKAQQERAVPYPFMSGEGPFIPRARAAFAKGEPATIWVPTYHLDSDSLQIQGRIVDQGGQEIAGKLDGLARSYDPNSSLDVISANLPKNLKAGSYRIELEVSDSASGTQASSSAAFEILD